MVYAPIQGMTAASIPLTGTLTGLASHQSRACAGKVRASLRCPRDLADYPVGWWHCPMGGVGFRGFRRDCSAVGKGSFTTNKSWVSGPSTW